MASVTWSGAYAENVDVRSAKTTSITTTDSLSALIKGASLTSLTANLTLRTNAYGRTYSLTVSLLSDETVIATKTVSVKLPGSGNQSYSVSFDVTGLTGETIAQINKLRLQAPAVSSGYLYTSTATQEITLQYTPITLTAPSNITITQHATNSKYNISWNAATGKNGAAGTSVKYNVYYGKSVSGTDAATNLVSSGSGITGTSISNIDLPGYGLYDFKVEALYSGLTTSLSVAKEFYGPSVTIPSTAPTISPTIGDSVTLSWGESSYSYTSGDPIKYQVRYQLDTGSEADYSADPVSGTSLTITSGWLEGKGAKDGSVIKFRVCARGGANLTNNLEKKTYIYSDYTSYSSAFTYDGKYTVGYNDGTGWQVCVVYYNDGTDWVECIPYYNDGTTWQPIKTKI